MEALDSTAVARMGLILGHLLAFALAAVGIAFGDLAIFRKRRVDTDMLTTAQSVVKWSLYGLWATGLAVIWLDTKFDLAVLATKPKLLAKLSVVVALSANGWLLHRVVFNRFTVAQDDPERAAVLPAIAGAISASSWLRGCSGLSRCIPSSLSMPASCSAPSPTTTWLRTACAHPTSSATLPAPWCASASCSKRSTRHTARHSTA